MIIEMSLDQHDRFLALCVPASREYEILKNGLIIRRPKEGHFERIIKRNTRCLWALAHVASVVNCSPADAPLPCVIGW
jgi:hypothetical protein